MMKNTGMTRPLDTLGRIVVPKEIRDSMGIKAGEGVHRSSSQHLAEKLKRLMREHPTAKQGEYAEWLRVSQGRISQLKKLL